MNPTRTLLRKIAGRATAMASLAIAPVACAGVLAPIVSVTGSHGGDQYANGMVSLTNGSGIDQSTDPGDPSTWAFSGGGYQDEWMASYLKDGGVPTPGTNNKLAWAVYDLGESKPLINFWFFNTNYAGGVSGVDQFNIYCRFTHSGPARPARQGECSRDGHDPPRRL